MNTAVNFTSSSTRPLGFRMRPDLRTRQQQYSGEPCRIVKDPLGLKYFRFHEADYAILEMLDGRTSMEEIKRRFEQRFAPERLTYAQIQGLIGRAHREGLILSNSPGQGAQLWQRRGEQLRKKRIAGLSNVLGLRWRGIDPEWLLKFLTARTAWMFSRGALGVVAALAVASLLLLFVQFDTFYARLPGFHEFFGPSNWLWLGLTLCLVKVLHELGHGLACKRFGGECHEIGFMLLVFTPALYCNVSDSWMLPNKWHRAAIGAAGMYVEVILASLATFLWWMSEPGLFNHLCLSVMFVCSVSTLMFNGNPLMRFDGYYILADLVEVPNLRSKATSMLQRWLFRGLLGIKLPDDPYTPSRNRLWLAAYGASSVVYRWLIVISIVFFLGTVLEPYGLKIVGRVLGLIAVATLVLPTCWQTAGLLRVPGRLHEMQHRRAITTTTGAIGLLLAVLFVPLPHHVTCPVSVEPQAAVGVFTVSPGRIESILVESGQQVTRGDDLAVLQNPELARLVINLERERDDLERQIEHLKRRRFGDPSVGLELPALNEKLASTREELRENQLLVENLRIVTPADGTVFPVSAAASGDAKQSAKPDWSLDPSKVGAMLPVGTELCRVGDAGRLAAVLLIDQADIEWVQPGQSVEIQLESDTAGRLRGSIESIAECQTSHLPAGMSTQSGGDVQVQSDGAGGVRPAGALYQARVPLEAARANSPTGLRGMARVHTGWRPLGIRIWRSLARTFRFKL